MRQGGLRPHTFCLPILKRERHRAAVLDAAASGEAAFFLGTDSAPHPKGAKVAESSPACSNCKRKRDIRLAPAPCQTGST